MKKLIFGMLMFFVSISNVFAVEHSDHDIVWVDDFTSITMQYNILTQSNTGLNLSCGPTSLLTVINYHNVKNQGFASWFTYDLISIHSYVSDIYSDMNIGFNTVVGTTDLKDYVNDNESFYSAVKANGSNTMETNLSLVRKWIKDDYPLIIALEASYSELGYEHIVVIYAYDGVNKQLYYYDPYFGENKKINFEDLSIAIQGNLPYLRVY